MFGFDFYKVNLPQNTPQTGWCGNFLPIHTRRQPFSGSFAGTLCACI